MSQRSMAAVPFCFLLLAGLSSGAARPEVAEEIRLHPADGRRVAFRAWNMSREVREGRILLNADHRGQPWAGILFQPGGKDTPLVTLTQDWVSNGAVRFQINGLADAYGQTRPPCAFQLRLVGCMGRYLRIPERFFRGEGGIDADADTWQEVLVPLRYVGVKPGGRVTALGIQCVGRPESAFGLASVSLVRFAKPLPSYADRAKADVAQPQVTWPAYEELPDALKLERNAPLLRDGKFVTRDGRRTFLIMPWGREDQKLALGTNSEGEVCPHFGLYDKQAQAFIYEQPLASRSMSRIGFNCYAGQVDPTPFWRAIGYQAEHWGRFTHAQFLEHVRQMGYPFYVDLVCFPWTLGKPAEDKNAKLPPGILHNGRHHWTPYRIIGKGRDTWLTMWTTYAERYRDAGARVLFYELMNEPAYLATTPDHRAEFIDWLKRRYGTLARVNETWGTKYPSWQPIQQFKSLRECTGIFFDYDEYLGDRFADLIRAGSGAIDKIAPGVPAAIQTMGGYTLQPREAVYLAKLIPIERAVLTPTGGGRWTRGFSNAAPKPNTIDYSIAPSPVANDLLLAMAGDKMVVDNEMYLGPGQSRVEMRNRWWKAVIAGIDGAAWFSWSKRGWAWWRGRENILREADLFPYSGLIPFARRADAIRGILDFATEIELVREFILPKPWGPPAKIALLHSWANARRRNWEPHLPDRTSLYHAAMAYLHWNFDMVPSHMAAPERLSSYDLLVAGGIDHVEPELLARLTAFVQNGGKLIVGHGTMGRDLYGKPLDSTPLLGLRPTGATHRPAGALKLAGFPESKLIPGDLTRAAGLLDVKLSPSTEALWRTGGARPAVTRHPLGKGEACFVAADVAGYPLARLLAALRQRTGPPQPLLLTDAQTGQLAPNILVSRRSYSRHSALLLMNFDPFPKLLRLRIRGLEGDWFCADPIEGHAFTNSTGRAKWASAAIAEKGINYAIGGNGRGLILLTRSPWQKTPLRPKTASDARALLQKHLRASQQRPPPTPY